MAKLKLSLFDTIQNDLREKIFLDGFAGSGNIGIEAISRGAEYAVFIDNLPEAVKTIQHNVAKIGIPTDLYRIIPGDFNRSIISLGNDGFQFDFIFLDPPYDLLNYANPLKVIFKRKVLKPEGTIFLERPSALNFNSQYFQCVRTRQLGKESIDFFQY